MTRRYRRGRYHKRLGLLNPQDRLRLGPVLLERVVVALGWREDMDDDGSEVEQHPVRARRPLPPDGPYPLLAHALDDPVGDRAQLPLRPARADDERIGERREAGQVEQADVGGLL